MNDEGAETCKTHTLHCIDYSNANTNYQVNFNETQRYLARQLLQCTLINIKSMNIMTIKYHLAIIIVVIH